MKFSTTHPALGKLLLIFYTNTPNDVFKDFGDNFIKPSMYSSNRLYIGKWYDCKILNYTFLSKLQLQCTENDMLIVLRKK